MQRTGSPDLVARTFGRDKLQQIKDFSHGDGSPKLGKIDSWHGRPGRTEKRNP
jgi:hypothetical protein